MENNLEKRIIEIEPRGFYFELDENGYVINPASPEKIQEEWKPVIDESVDVYKKLYGDKLKNVYIRGSVARGKAIKDISDLDTFAYVDMTNDEIKSNFELELDFEKVLLSKYPFVVGIEFDAQPIENNDRKDSLIFLSQSLCVYGEPVEVPKLKPGKEMVIHVRNLHKRIDWFQYFLEKNPSDQEIKNKCSWIMKGLIRSGFEIVMERSGKYTRDLYPCYETFSEYYPEREDQMKEVLYLTLNPTSDKNKIKNLIENLGMWLSEEGKKYV